MTATEVTAAGKRAAREEFAPEARPGRVRSQVLGALSLAAGLVAWQLAYDLFIQRSLFISSPTKIVATFWRLLKEGELYPHIWASGAEFAYGYVLSVVVGIPLGFFMATNRKINHYLDPWVAALYATPRIALAPLVVIWFGIGLFSKSLIVFLGAVFYIILNTYTGIRGVRENLIEVVKAFGGSRIQVFFKVMVPDAIPAIITGMRLAVGRGIIGVVVAEWFGATAGLGYMVYYYSQVFQPSEVLVGIGLLTAIGYVSFYLLERLQQWISPWYQIQIERELGGTHE
ncbi:MAG: ABC transporter permease [Deltaproteobacteria bacterium]|nr:ABC transporter permease [Deltaproteobacteria bacterium]MBI3077029.1 ABC transporter permease [Deltaproteobacteria bacterium]